MISGKRSEKNYELTIRDIMTTDGLCAWVILQYMRGYKPFVTMILKETNFENVLK